MQLNIRNAIRTVQCTYINILLFQFELLLHCQKRQTRIECVKLYIFANGAAGGSNNQWVIWVGNLIFEIKIINKKKRYTN